ncbi:MAG: hypothetical protein GF411_05245 [Candidatus Lokiarchaeota archaeon]|nr:hypothetical protein [Candidatus Lokiarchaeota archaeon]
MQSWKLASLFVMLSIIGSLPFVVGHVPIGSGPGETLDTAADIDNPIKSWVTYQNLHEGAEAQYFRFEFNEGERIRLILGIPVHLGETGFSPGVVLMGPDVSNVSSVPSYVETSPDSGYLVLDGVVPENAYYEGFTPSTYYKVVDIDSTANATGTYYLAIHDPNYGGEYMLAIGYVEAYNLDEWILVPVYSLQVYQWEGQNLLLALSPFLALIAIGIIFLYSRKNNLPVSDPVWSIAVLCGFMYLGSAASFAFQTAYVVSNAIPTWEFGVSIVFTLIPLLLGMFTLRLLLNPIWKTELKNQLHLLVFGALGYLVWAGLLIAPTVLIVLSIIRLIQTKRKAT